MRILEIKAEKIIIRTDVIIVIFSVDFGIYGKGGNRCRYNGTCYCWISRSAFWQSAQYVYSCYWGEYRKEFLQATGTQLDKLDFLIQGMVKTSRLETGVITLEKQDAVIGDTLVSAINGVLAPMEQKEISLSVDCPSDLTISHDSRWTSEALFNILDNAVKYTSAGGSIQVRVRDWEMYLRIDVTDTGRGIPEHSQGTIFKRFYRDEAVHDIDGVGIGLYLAREIITMQGGYITVESKVGEGSTFSVFLPIK